MVPYYAIVNCLLAAFFLLLIISKCNAGGKLDVVYQWKQVDFTYPSQQVRDAALRSGKFIPENCVILDVDVWQQKLPDSKSFFFNGGHNNKPVPQKRIFVSLPRFKAGIPVTLATVTNQRRGEATLLAPYPNWGAQLEGNCAGITSAYRTMIDDCGRLWVIDSGKIENFETVSKQICPPKVLAFDLKNHDRLLVRYPIPNSQLEHDSLLVTLTVDTRDENCKDTFVYIADVTAFKLIVYDVINNNSWRVSSNYFYPFPLYGHFNIAGTRFNLMDGLLALALGPLKNGDRQLYFHSLASIREGSISTSILRNRTLFESDSDAAFQLFNISESARPSQSAMEVMTSSGVMLFSLLSEIALACWNSKTPYTSDNIHAIIQDNETLQFPSGMKIIGNSVWIATSKLQNYIAGNADPNDVKYRILHGYLDDLLKGTGCDISDADDYDTIDTDFQTEELYPDYENEISNWEPLKTIQEEMPSNQLNQNRHNNIILPTERNNIYNRVNTNNYNNRNKNNYENNYYYNIIDTNDRINRNFPIFKFESNTEPATTSSAWSYDCRLHGSRHTKNNGIHIICSFISPQFVSYQNKYIPNFL